MAIVALGVDLSLARARRAERAGPLAERALHDARRRVAALARGARASRSLLEPSRRARAPWSLARRALVLARVVAGRARAWSRSSSSHQAPNMRDQIWFFGRASRNIRDQHIIAGRVLGRDSAPEARARRRRGRADLRLRSRRASISSGSAATTICPSRAPACTASAPRSSSSSACPRRERPDVDGHLPVVVGRSADAGSASASPRFPSSAT